MALSILLTLAHGLRTQGFLADWIHRVHDRPMGGGEAVPVGFGDL